MTYKGSSLPLAATLNLMLLLHLCVCLWLSVAMALRNITVDDRSSLITYTPATEWIVVDDTLDAGGGHMLTNYIRGEAAITYTFVNMYYMSTRWHYHVGAVIEVDGQVGIADMRDYTAPPNLDTLRATMASSVVWSYKGDGMKERKITIKVPQGDDLTVVDMFIFEVDDELTTSLSGSVSGPTAGPVASATSNTSPSPSTSSTTTLPPSSSNQSAMINSSRGLSSQTKAMVISLSIVGTTLLGLLLFLLYWFYIRKVLKKDNRAEKILPIAKKPMEADGKTSGNSPRASIGQASNSPSNDEEPEGPVPVHQNISQSATASAPLPERRPTIIARPVPATNLQRNPTTVSVQHGLDPPRASRNGGQDTGTTLDPVMGDD